MNNQQKLTRYNELVSQEKAWIKHHYLRGETEMCKAAKKRLDRIENERILHIVRMTAEARAEHAQQQIAARKEGER